MEFDLDFEINLRWRKNYLLSYGEAEYDTTRGIRSTDNWTWFSNLDHSFQGKWYYAGALMLKKDRFADLKLRTLVGPGLVHRLRSKNLETPVTNLPSSNGLRRGQRFRCCCPHWRGLIFVSIHS